MQIFFVSFIFSLYIGFSLAAVNCLLEINNESISLFEKLVISNFALLQQHDEKIDAVNNIVKSLFILI